ncbi:G-protein coupled receptor family C group 6 member A-like [Centruroides sculpturatus]|uniref:G-protein coupled receptor family C group 6 member A-like n=1 Tax=Centruroides sculpturatus TaxID=218467 RepID=UPI000C6E8E7D|nr:G-protein coupled receptor family C group 6 member A-like [Centruroides sculpturatus]XP_023232480.1 G-protein coupled receptor family C group 6 member A-like [Centruroides sculpturatus]
MKAALLFLLVFSVLCCSVFCNTCQPTQDTYLKTEGDIFLVGLFDLHHGRHCQLVKKGGQQQMLAASTVIDWINNSTIFDDVKIGFLSLDTCSDVQTTTRQIIRGLTETKFLNSCEQHRLLGFLGPSNSRIHREVLNFLRPLSVPYVPIKITDLHSEIRVIVEILAQFSWFKIALLSVSEELEEDFYQAAADSNICVTVSSIITHSRDDYDHFFKETVEKSIDVIVLLGTEYELEESIQSANSNVQNKFYWLAAGLMQENIELNLDSYKPVVRSLLVVESSEILNNEKYENLIKKLDNEDLCLDCYASDPSVRAAMMGVLKYTWAMKKIKDAECLSENKKCPHLKKIIKKQLIKKLNGNFHEEFKELPFQTGNSTIWSYQDASQSNAIFHQVSSNYLKYVVNINTNIQFRTLD